MWAIPLKTKSSQNITNEFSNILTTSKRSPVKLESDRGAEFYNSVFQNVLKSKNIHQYSRFTDKRPSIAERVIRCIRNLMKKPVFEKGNADWLKELSAVISKYNNSFHNSTKLTPIQTSKIAIERKVYSNLKDRRKFRKPMFGIGQLVRTADIERVKETAQIGRKLYTIIEVIHDIILTYRINYLAERYNENLLLPTKLTLDENNKVMKELNLIQ